VKLLKKAKNINATLLLVLLIISVLINIGLTFYNTRVLLQNSLLRQDLFNEDQKGFHLLSPSIAWLSVDEFLQKQQTYMVSYASLKPRIQEELTKNVQGKFGFYFEDLTTGAWLGINEKDSFLPISLMKVPLMVAVLKKVEKGDLSLGKNIELAAADIDTSWGELSKKGAGEQVSVKDMLESMIEDSDNTAYRALSRTVGQEAFDEALLALGLPIKMDSTISPKDYGNMLRSLYISSYLRRPMSELALNMMLRTKYNTQIPAGVPTGIPIAHKVGFNFEIGEFHDCGIVYIPQKPYIICLMSRESSNIEADRVISAVSKIVYDYVSSNNSAILAINPNNTE
jgi:beta-lactamase class A